MAARRDFTDIIEWTAQQFGRARAESYAALIRNGLARLRDGPDCLGTSRRDDLSPAIRLLRPIHGRQLARQVIAFRQDPEAPSDRLEVLRILHDAMDLARHLGQGDSS